MRAGLGQRGPIGIDGSRAFVARDDAIAERERAAVERLEDGAAPQERAVGSATAHLLSIQQGACMVRAHDVKATADAIKVWQAMQMA